MDQGTAAIGVAVIAAIPGALAYRASKRGTDTDATLRSDDAAWTRLQQTVHEQAEELRTIRADQARSQGDFVLLQHKFQEAVEHGERCDAALEEANRMIATHRHELDDLRRRLDDKERP